MDSTFWIKLVVIIGSVLLLLFVFNIVMGKLLGVERKKFFSYNHVNDLHKNIDWTLRIILILVMLSIIIVINSIQRPVIPMPTSVALTIFIIISEAVRAFMEWKYASNPRDYILTLSQLGLYIIILGSLFYYADKIV